MPAGSCAPTSWPSPTENGTPVQDVLVPDASRRTTALNAYVSGFGSTRRIVVFDTVLDQLPDDEIESIAAHELGHVATKDVLTGRCSGPWAQRLGSRRWAGCWPRPAAAPRRRRGPRRPQSRAARALHGRRRHPAGTPLENLVSATWRRADVHALDLTRDPEAFIEMQRRPGPHQPQRPGPAGRLAVVLRIAPPTAAKRVAFAETGRSWSAGEPHPRRHQRLPPRQGGIQTFVAGAPGAPAAGHPRRARLRFAGLGRARRRAPYPVVPPADEHAAPHTGDGRPGRRPGSPVRLRQRVLRGGGPAGADGAGPAAAGCRHLVGATTTATRPAGRRCPAPGSCSSASPGTLDVVTYISEYTRDRLTPALAGGPGWRSCHRASTSTGSPGRRRRRRPEAATTWATRRSWSACPGWSPARGRTCSSRLAAGAARGPGGAAAACRRRPGRALAAPGGGRPGVCATLSSSPVRWTPPSCPGTTPRATSSPCPAAPAGAGLDVEGLGMVFLEAAACGRPVGRHVGWRSGDGPGGGHRPRRGPAVPGGRGDDARRPARRPGAPGRWAGGPRLGGAALVLGDDRDAFAALLGGGARPDRPVAAAGNGLSPISPAVEASTSASNSFMTTERLSFRLGVSIPLSSVKSWCRAP